MAGYASRVKNDIARWVDGGLIDAATGAALSTDIESRRGGGISFGSVLAMMAGTLLGAAILIFIAANWEAFPRLARVVLLFLVILAGYVGGALLKLRDRGGFGEALWLVAASAFGASIALIGQMYHLSGDEKQAIFVWGAGTALAAVMLRSGPLTVGAALLGGTWMTMVALGSFEVAGPPVSYLLIVAALWGASFWTLSAVARHVLLLSLYLFVVLFYLPDQSFNVPIALALLSAGLLVFGHYRRADADRYIGLGAGLAPQALAGFLIGMGILQLELMERPEFLIVSVVVMAGILAALLVEGRRSAILRWLAYAAFGFQICYIYIVTLGTMLGTAGFFLVVGTVLAALAVLIGRLERRLAARSTEEVAS